jgi:hypothetical protein
MLAFTMDWREYQAIEQNTEKPSRWGQMTRAGHQVASSKTRERTGLRRCPQMEK